MATPEAARKSGHFFIVSMLPDACLTPMGKKKKVVLYNIVADLSTSEEVSENVFFTDEPAFLIDKSFVPKVEGNEAGIGDGADTSGVDERGNGGVKTQMTEGLAFSFQGDETVLVNDKLLVRHLDRCWMNLKEK
jgi:hypothetical protein